METAEKVLIKNYSLDKKEYELGRQIILDFTRSDLIKLLKELPVVEHYLKIEIISKKIDIKKIGENKFTYSMYQRNFVLIKKKRSSLMLCSMFLILLVFLEIQIIIKRKACQKLCRRRIR